MRFYLGTHMPAWVNRYDLPFFISCRVVLKRKSALNGDWILDSAGFTELMKNGKYLITEEEYLKCVSITKPKLAFSQDWMCEQVILDKTGKTIKEHQELTCRNYISLKKHCNIIYPVLQGWSKEDYVDHVKMYKKFGVSVEQLFGVGTICKRNSKPEIVYEILASIKNEAPCSKLHGFGLKVTSLKEKRIKSLLWSADSMAWSFAGRYQHIGCDGCKNKNCANCYTFAKQWYDDLLRQIDVDKRVIS